MASPKELGGGVGGNTVIGPSILINGKLSGDEDLTVRGRVEGELTLTKTLIVEPSGVIKADATVRNAIVSGVVVGNINASESVELTKEGRMVGDIRSPRVIIVDGASFRGRVDMGEGEPGKAGERPPRPVVRTSPGRAPSLPPRPPPPPAKSEKGEKGKGAPGPKVETKPLPPAPPLVAAGAKKKVVVKKKG